MARCPKCRYSYREMDDEQGQHDCPSCGYGPESVERCSWCGVEIGPDLTDADDYPYCSPFCSVRAEVESMEDCND